MLQGEVSQIPSADRLLIETFPHEGREQLCLYGFAGQNAHRTLGLILTQRMEAAGLSPLGFVVTDYALLIWGLEPVDDPAALLDPTDMRAGLDQWLQGNAVMKRNFRGVATIAGLIEKNIPGPKKTGRQATFSSDILYDTLAKYDPEHLLMRITRDEALHGLVDFGRIEDMLARIAGIDHRRLSRVSPLAAPLFLEPGKVPIVGEGRERLMAAETERLMAEAGLSAL
jgi:ATP-dependent Lhr-like helicase